MSDFKTMWKPHEWERAKRLRQNGSSIAEIALVLGVKESRVQMKFSNEGARLRMEAGTHQLRNGKPPNTVLIERERALAATLSLTAATFGDPRPGRSALDRRRNNPSSNLGAPPPISAVVKAGLSR